MRTAAGIVGVFAVLNTAAASAHDIRAPILHRIHQQRDRTWRYQRLSGTCCRPYAHTAEHSPSRAYRRWVLRLWHRLAMHARWHYDRLARAPWPSWWRVQAGCIHRHESTRWHEPGSPGGGMQFEESTWISNDGGRYASWPSEATPREQLLTAWRLWRADGGSWQAWTTAPLCGLS